MFGINSVEEANYDVVKAEGKYEIRLYEPIVIAETYVEGNFDNAGDIAFKKLFGYISGTNTLSNDIAMTAPVLVNRSGPDQSENIKMTVPVIEERKGPGWRYIFVLPESYSIETAPLPLHQDVKLSTEPQKRVAVIRFSGSWDEKIIDEKIVQLNQWITANNMTVASNPRWAGYNPPWTLPFLRRNEVMIEVL